MKRINAKYSMLQGTYWFANCAVFPFLILLYRHYGMGDRSIGFVCAAISGANVAASLLVGTLCDRFHTVKRLLIPAVVLGAGISLLLPLCQGIPVEIGIVAVVMNVCIVALKDVIDGWGMRLKLDGVPLNFGFCRSFGEVFYALGAGIFGLVYDRLGMDILPAVLVILSAGVICAMALLPDVKGAGERPDMRGAFAALAGNKAFLVLMGCMFLTYMGSNSLFTYYPLLLQELGGGSGLYGIALCFMALCDVPVMMLSDRLFRRIEPGKLLGVSFLFHAVRMAVISLSPSLPAAVGFLGLQCLSLGLTTIALLHDLSGIVPEKLLLSAQAIVYAAANLGGMAGVSLSGVISEALGIRTMLRVMLCFPAAAFLSFFLTKQRTRGADAAKPAGSSFSG